MAGKRELCGGKACRIGRRYAYWCPLPMAGYSVCCILSPSHFAIPIGMAVWLATNI
ncbi:MAG: hypothetical protein IJL54_02055 [Prevotella sp.]|nr:hypothetical protein [Prevotella sp.]